MIPTGYFKTNLGWSKKEFFSTCDIEVKRLKKYQTATMFHRSCNWHCWRIRFKRDCFNQISFCLSFDTLNSQIFSSKAKLDFLLLGCWWQVLAVSACVRGCSVTVSPATPVTVMPGGPLLLLLVMISLWGSLSDCLCHSSEEPAELLLTGQLSTLSCFSWKNVSQAAVTGDSSNCTYLRSHSPSNPGWQSHL